MTDPLPPTTGAPSRPPAEVVGRSRRFPGVGAAILLGVTGAFLLGLGVIAACSSENLVAVPSGERPVEDAACVSELFQQALADATQDAPEVTGDGVCGFGYALVPTRRGNGEEFVDLLAAFRSEGGSWNLVSMAAAEDCSALTSAVPDFPGQLCP